MKHGTAVIVLMLLGVFAWSANSQTETRSRGLLHNKPTSTADSDVLSSNFWKNAKEEDFDRIFLPHGLTFDDLSPAQQKKVWYRMFRKAIKARQGLAGGLHRPAITFKDTPTTDNADANEIINARSVPRRY